MCSLYPMIINGHEETTGEEIDWACDTRDELKLMKGGVEWLN